ncbi:putative RNA-directed DNA polymerase, eukaryota, reverse transcriptase zinc-binding domain protein [Tanacetum coccineum]
MGRCREERLGSTFVESDANAFNDFINTGRLHDFALGGRRFKRYNKEGFKLSKLDRFLVSSNFFTFWKNAKVTTLCREVSDHCPLMLLEDPKDFEPKCFKLFNHRMEEDGFNKVIEASWDSGDYSGSADIVLKNKLKQLKGSFRENQKQKERYSRLDEWDAKVKAGILTSLDCLKLEEDRMVLNRLDQNEKDSLKQKSRVKWAIEGDENTKFFHSIVNKKGKRNQISGLNITGNWVENPSAIYSEAIKHFSIRFHDPQPNRPKFKCALFRQLDQHDRCFLDSSFTLDEVKEVVWNCCGSKPPGPDGFNFNIIKRYWEIIKIEFFNFIEYSRILSKLLANGLSKVIHKLISPNQSAFLTGRQILDGSLIANEIIDVASKEKLRLLLFKVDFEKAFDTSASILINGSPSKEFPMKRGLRQGDPLSPLLGLPVGRSMRKIVDWIEVINRFSKRLASWKVNLLSIGGRLTLVKSVLGSLPLYFLSLFKAPEAIINKLESMRRQIFLGNERRKLSGQTDGDLAKLVTDLNGLTLDEAQDDKWEWTLTSSRKFSVASLCRAIHLRVNTNDVSAPPFTWNLWVSRKVNVCAWRCRPRIAPHPGEAKGLVEEDDRKRARFRGGKISLGRKKSWGSNSGNTGDGGKTVGGAIGARGSGIGDSLLVALYACITFIYGSSWKGEMANKAKRSLVKSSEESEGCFPVRLGNSPVKPGYSQECF